MARTVFNNGITVDVWAFWSSPILDDSLVGIANDYDISIAYEQFANVQSAMRITSMPYVSVSAKYGFRIAWKELKLLPDMHNKARRTVEYGNKKGFKTKDYWEEIVTSYVMWEYLRRQNTLQWASSDVIQEYIELTQDSKDLNLGRMETYIIEHVALFTQWRSDDSDYWPWSMTPNGQPLFSDSHPVLWTWDTFSNVLSTENKELTNVYLQEALDILKTGVRLQNWKFVKQWGWTPYKLFVGTTLAVTARQILNTYGKVATMFSWGYGATSNTTNASQINKFYFEWNLVEIEEIPNIWEPLDTSNGYGYGSTLWAQTYRFAMNPFVIDRAQALKQHTLYPPLMKNYQTPSNDNYVIDIRCNQSVDHYYAECWIVGSKGTVAA